MAQFSELIKNFDKIREYMRGFYIYGFKVRGDYTEKSARTYDNERRRVACWMDDAVRWEYSPKGKRVFLSLDSSQVRQNPLYAAWKSKSFTKNDIMLHFFLLDLMRDLEPHGVDELTDLIASRYGVLLDTQAVRTKLREYERLGVFTVEKTARAQRYRLNQDDALRHWNAEGLLDAVRFFQEVAPFGFIGSTILERFDAENDLFLFKHHYMVHTLEDGVLYDILQAIYEGRMIRFQNLSRRSGSVHTFQGVPLKILTSLRTGRRYLCLYRADVRRFTNLRLDSIGSVELLDAADDLDDLLGKLEHNLPKCWGVCFGGRKNREEQLIVKLYIDEQKEQHLLKRLYEEGRGAQILHIGRNLYLYSTVLFDAGEAMPWIKTFIGHIVSLECTNREVTQRFYSDLSAMKQMYLDCR
ncbi:WYL domain-containing protein [Candidatus Soleaferrea massiliensis]|uniref:WYL domain-containing protein n=1 Tax=Candidatus Soleaferrea massiliensis TaxID=1470354 RepID=UPI00058FD435|nr:WYL domain-containing protein [Candidatus Soleaferrea massiliensis]